MVTRASSMGCVDEQILRTNLANRLKYARQRTGGFPEQIDQPRWTAFERGEETPDSLEWVRITDEFGLPADWFFEPGPPPVPSRLPALVRESPSIGSDQSPASFDTELERRRVEVTNLAKRGIVTPQAAPEWRSPKSWEEAEQRAKETRALVFGSESAEPIQDLSGFSEQLGLLVFEAESQSDTFDGSVVEALPRDENNRGLAVAVIAPGLQPWRQRWAIGHEFGHWLFGGAYADCGLFVGEQMVNAFVAHLLMPRAVTEEMWRDANTFAEQRAAIASISTARGTGWTATTRHVGNLGLIPNDHDTIRLLNEGPGNAYDELQDRRAAQPMAAQPPRFVSDIRRAVASGTMPQGEALTTLDGGFDLEDLPAPPVRRRTRTALNR